MVLDCPTDMAKDIVVSHVRDVTLGRRTYHYLLSGLVSLELHRFTNYNREYFSSLILILLTIDRSFLLLFVITYVLTAIKSFVRVNRVTLINGNDSLR